MNSAVRSWLHPMRRLAARFVGLDVASAENSIIHKAANLVSTELVPGDYLEFGVFAGGSFADAYHVLRKVFAFNQRVHAGRSPENSAAVKDAWDRMRFFAFDSFQGLPELTGVDKETTDFSAGKYSCGQREFLANLQKSGVDLARVVPVAGWFEDSCTEATRAAHQMEHASIIHVDCDLYSSTKTVLEFVRPLLVDGTILIFDDWYCYRGHPNFGERRAFEEWQRTMPAWTFTEYQKEGPWRNSFIASKL